MPYLSEKIWALLKQSIGGFLGVTGFLLSLVMVPIYLFFLLKGARRSSGAGGNIFRCGIRL